MTTNESPKESELRRISKRLAADTHRRAELLTELHAVGVSFRHLARLSKLSASGVQKITEKSVK